MTDQCFYVPRFSFTNFKCICMMGQEKEIHSIGDKNTILEGLGIQLCLVKKTLHSLLSGSSFSLR